MTLTGSVPALLLIIKWPIVTDPSQLSFGILENRRGIIVTPLLVTKSVAEPESAFLGDASRGAALEVAFCGFYGAGECECESGYENKLHGRIEAWCPGDG